MSRRVSWMIAVALLALAGNPARIAAQPDAEPKPSMHFEPKGKEPIDVTADGDLEVDQDTKRIFARDNAKAVQGNSTITADVLIADYRQKTGGGSSDNEIYRLFARGHVTMTSNEDVATGPMAVYDLDKAVLVMEGDPLKFTSPSGTVTAHRILQYWSNERVAVGEGNAVAVDKNSRRLFGDKLVAFFRDQDEPNKKNGQDKQNAQDKSSNPHGEGDIVYVQGFGHVRMETKDDLILGDRGDYNIDTGLSTIEGSVKLTHNNVQSLCGFALVRVNGGISRCLQSAAAAKMPSVSEDKRVRALIAPKATPDDR